MAEAAVEDRAQLFYCHMCNVQFENASTVSSVFYIREIESNQNQLESSPYRRIFNTIHNNQKYYR